MHIKPRSTSDTKSPGLCGIGTTQSWQGDTGPSSDTEGRKSIHGQTASSAPSWPMNEFALTSGGSVLVSRPTRLKTGTPIRCCDNTTRHTSLPSGAMNDDGRWTQTRASPADCPQCRAPQSLIRRESRHGTAPCGLGHGRVQQVPSPEAGRHRHCRQHWSSFQQGSGPNGNTLNSVSSSARALLEGAALAIYPWEQMPRGGGRGQ
ncbi:hypothetical protein B0T19DRAFT_75337 [Cercophora scortea]|uniref:Uncharacterized protein n=1 Tax=Cercophora scortea TaxID=314031 RepID=A0AAE0J6I4_9PEZI|nr:hypothetical protein B0T19DRAFT_75337 [Cercophora scortea]